MRGRLRRLNDAQTGTVEAAEDGARLPSPTEAQTVYTPANPQIQREVLERRKLVKWLSTCSLFKGKSTLFLPLS